MLLVRFCGNGAVAVPLSEVKRPEKEKASAGVEQFKDMTLEELRSYNGETSGKPVLVAIQDKIYDVSSSDFYSKGGTYNVFAGRDAARALAKMDMHNTEPLDDPRTDDLSLAEIDTLNEWIMKFDSKYPVVGRVMRSGKDKKEG
eukprot:g3780.t1